MKRSLLLISSYDREDGGIYGSTLCFEVPEEKTATYEDAIIHLLPVLNSEEVVQTLCDEDFLEEHFNQELFGDEEEEYQTYKFVRAEYRKYGLYFDFVGEKDGQEVEYRKSLDFVTLIS